MASNKHKCNRDDCPAENINGSKAKCIKCGNLCYLKCYGLGKSENIENTEIVKILLPNGSSMFAFLPFCAFVCCADSMSNVELRKVMKIPKATRSTSRSRQTTEISTVISELNEIKGLISGIKDKSTEIHDDTQLLVSKSIEPKVTAQTKQITSSNFSLHNTPKTSFARNTVNSFADAVRNYRPPTSAKRQRTEDSPKPFIPPVKNVKFDAPKPKMGTKTLSTRLHVVAKPQRIEKQKFSKAIWVSGFEPATTPEEIVEYIESETPVSDKSKFNVHKLVKKDMDVSSLRFVSFKIEVNEEEFVVLCNPDMWQENVMVREFLQNNRLGDFFPALNQQENRKSPALDLMDLTESKSSPSKVTQSSGTMKRTTPKDQQTK